MKENIPKYSFAIDKNFCKNIIFLKGLLLNRAKKAVFVKKIVGVSEKLKN
jgi:hypothetical protein